jgi:hypothetical protein
MKAGMILATGVLAAALAPVSAGATWYSVRAHCASIEEIYQKAGAPAAEIAHTPADVVRDLHISGWSAEELSSPDATEMRTLSIAKPGEQPNLHLYLSSLAACEAVRAEIKAKLPPDDREKF